MSIGIGEIVIILLVAFVFVGPDNLPKIAKATGKLVNKNKTILKDAKEEMDLGMDNN